MKRSCFHASFRPAGAGGGKQASSASCACSMPVWLWRPYPMTMQGQCPTLVYPALSRCKLAGDLGWQLGCFLRVVSLWRPARAGQPAGGWAQLLHDAGRAQAVGRSRSHPPACAPTQNGCATEDLAAATERRSSQAGCSRVRCARSETRVGCGLRLQPCPRTVAKLSPALVRFYRVSMMDATGDCCLLGRNARCRRFELSKARPGGWAAVQHRKRVRLLGWVRGYRH